MRRRNFLKVLPAATVGLLPRPSMGAEPLVVSKLSRIRAELGDIYLTLLTGFVEGGLKKEIGGLLGHLVDLQKLDSEIAALARNNGGAFEKDLAATAAQQRAMAWLHGWAALSQVLTLLDSTPHRRKADETLGELSQRIQDLDSESPKVKTLRGALARARTAADLREDLLRKEHGRLLALPNAQTPSVLGLLLDIYQQIRGATTATEPLRSHMTDGLLFILQLSYEEEWRDGEKPAVISHRFYIPSRRDLVGEPHDAPEAQRHIFSLWALVNWQCDQLQPISRDRNGQPQNNRIVEPILTDWLLALEKSETAKAFDREGERLVGDLQARIGPMREYLQFRASVVEHGAVRDLVEKVRSARLSSTPLANVVELTPLLASARPLGAEFLYPAAVWLRYILTLSFQNAGDEITDPQMGLKAWWQKEELAGDPMALPEPTSRDVKFAFLRWNSLPLEGHSARVVADLWGTTLNFIVARQAINRRENDRFEAIGYRPLNTSYGKLAGNQARELRKVQEQNTAKYFVNAEGRPSRESLLQGTVTPLGRFFHASTSAAEQVRMAEDLAAIHTQISSFAGTQDLVAKAYATTDAEERGALLQQVAGLSGISDWNMYAMPTRSFRQYSRALEDAIAGLDKELEQAAMVEELRARFRQKSEAVRLAELNLAVTSLGVEIAQRSQALGTLLVQIGEMDSELADLEVKAAELEAQGLTQNAESKRMALALAGRMRDLAAGKVEAVRAAGKVALEVAEKAKLKITQMQRDLKGAAIQIKEQKDHDTLMGVINAVVMVVGAALAPFTGGASLSVAALASQAIRVIDKMSSGPWKGLESLAAIGQAVDQGIKAGVVLGADLGASEETLAAFGDVQKFLSGGLAEAQRLSAAGKQLLSGLGNLSRGEITNFASAIASGCPINLSDGAGKIKLAVGDKQFPLPSLALATSLATLFERGGICVNSFLSQPDAVATLLSAQGVTLRGHLREAVKNSFTLIPSDDLLEKFDSDIVGARQRFEEAKSQLLTTVEAMSEDAAGQLANLIGRGMFFGQVAGGKVVGFQPEIPQDVARFGDRLRRYQERIAGGEIQALVDNLQKKGEEVQKAADQLISSNDDVGLFNFADNVLPTKLDEVQAELDAFALKIAAAQDELEDEESKHRIANYDARAAEFFSSAGGVRREAALVRARKAELGRSIISEQIATADLQFKAQNLRGQISRSEVGAARRDLVAFYDACLARGINPRTGGDAARIDAERIDGALLSGLLVNPRTANGLDREVKFDRMAESAIGMLKWINLMGMSTAKAGAEKPIDLYAKVIAAVNRREADKLEEIRKKLQETYNSADGRMEGSFFQMTGTDRIFGNRITWTADLSEGERRELLAGVSSEIRGKVVGLFRFLVAPASPSEAVLERFVDLHVPLNVEHAAYYVRIPNIDLVYEGSPATLPLSNLSFLVVPPAHPTSNPRTLSQSRDPGRTRAMPIGQPQKLVEAIEDQLVIQGISSNVLGTVLDEPQLLGHYGEWTFFLVSSVAIKPADLKAMKETLRLKLKMAQLHIATN